MLSRLARACAHAFSARSRTQGFRDYDAGSVQLLGHIKQRIFARCEGHRVEVDFTDREKGQLKARCSCPFFCEGHACKHIYGALIAVEAEERAPALDRPQGQKFSLELLEPTSQKDDEPLDEEYPKKPVMEWRTQLDTIRQSMVKMSTHPEVRTLTDIKLEHSRPRTIHYHLNVRRSLESQGLVIEFYSQSPNKDGSLGKLRPFNIATAEVKHLPDLKDQEALELLLACPLEVFRPGQHSLPNNVRAEDGVRTNSSLVPPGYYQSITRALCATGRLTFAPEDGTSTKPLVFDRGRPWSFELRLRGSEEEPSLWRLTGQLRRGVETRALTTPKLLLASGLVAFEDTLAALDVVPYFEWIGHLRRNPAIVFTQTDREALLTELHKMPNLPPIDLPIDRKYPWVFVEDAPKPKIVFLEPNGMYVAGCVSFFYDGDWYRLGEPTSGKVDEDKKRFVRRDPLLELQAMETLGAMGALRDPSLERDRIEVRKSELVRIVRALVEAGWHVEAGGQVHRKLTDQTLDISSEGQDWFDLEGTFDFDGVQVGLPQLLKAARSADGMIQLDDGSLGLLPEDWLEQYSLLLEMGKLQKDRLRFSSKQALMLDALLKNQKDVYTDAAFKEARDQLQKAGEVRPIAAPQGFVGSLRGYQRDGLGWLSFLDKLGLGGCLADDMGLGKTVQVLALLLQQKNAGETKPALVVAPRSLVHNWVDEAERFAPQLKVLDYTGAQREKLQDQIPAHNLVITTYGTVRRDILSLKDRKFSCVILDEAQAIKNPDSQSSKACRLLQAKTRFALSGTPVENHLIELWSIFEFLNPKMLGTKRKFMALANNTETLSKALRPLILRRTKAQVLPELPEKTELTIYCELNPAQRKAYNELRDYYRTSLTKRIEKEGLAKSQIQVLEALLRLRQAACHPGLVDPDLTEHGSAKLETLLEQLKEVTAEGHKALVFSQFVSLLSIVKKRLDREKLSYEYLDGQTKDRKKRVENFQNRKDLNLFLISLKAGAYGLNLTAADYVFILDPWWNPAVESQAIDRAHRMGQSRAVFAYRLIAKDTVEEKILTLQQNKRNLADAIISKDQGSLGRLTLEDLQRLLGE